MADTIVRGLPEGVELTGDFNPTGEKDYELIRIGEETAIYQGPRVGAATGIKVKPADGYVFVKIGKERFDIIKYQEGRDKFIAAKVIPEKTVTVTATFKVSNQYDSNALDKAIKTVQEMPGFVAVTVS